MAVTRINQGRVYIWKASYTLGFIDKELKELIENV